MVIFDSKTVSIEYYSEHNCVYYKAKGYVNSKEFRENAQRIIEAVRDKKVNYLVNDLTDSGVISPEDQAWIVAEFSAKLIPLGVSESIAILPTSIFGKLSAQAVEKKINEEKTSLTPMFFPSKKEAFEWIEENEKKSK